MELKKMLKYWICLMLAIASMLSMSVISYATDYYVKSSGGNLFKNGTEQIATVSYGNSWSRTEYFDSGKGILKYGYNTTLINEDWATSYHKTKSHQTKVNNSKKSATSVSASAGQYTSTVSVRHYESPAWHLLC